MGKTTVRAGFGRMDLSQRRRDDNKNIFFRSAGGGGGIGGERIIAHNAVFLGKRHGNGIVKMLLLLSRILVSFILQILLPDSWFVVVVKTPRISHCPSTVSHTV